MEYENVDMMHLPQDYYAATQNIGGTISHEVIEFFG
jgi:hypothetical protein